MAGSPGMAAVRSVTASVAVVSARFSNERIRMTCSCAATAGSVTVPMRSRIKVSADSPRPWRNRALACSSSRASGTSAPMAVTSSSRSAVTSGA